MSDSLPNIYYSSESNKFINMENKQQLSSSLQSKSQSESEDQQSNYINNNMTQSIEYNPKIETKENPIQYDENLPTELNGTIISIPDFSLSNTNIVIGGITLYIKDDKGNTFEIQANPKDLVIDIMERYRNVAKINNNYRIFFMKQNGEGLHRQMSLDAQDVKNKDIINAKQLSDEMRKKLKENIKNGLTFFIIDSQFGNEAFYGKGKIRFKIFADKFREKYPGKKFIYRYSGMIIKDEMKTIEELGFEQSERVFADVVEKKDL